MKAWAVPSIKDNAPVAVFSSNPVCKHCWQSEYTDYSDSQCSGIGSANFPCMLKTTALTLPTTREAHVFALRPSAPCAASAANTEGWLPMCTVSNEKVTGYPILTRRRWQTWSLLSETCCLLSLFMLAVFVFSPRV